MKIMKETCKGRSRRKRTWRTQENDGCTLLSGSYCNSTLTGPVGGPSLHNDNRGIKMTINFTPIPPPLEAGKKRQANTKAPVITKIGYFHEDMGLHKFLAKVVALLKHEYLLEQSHLYSYETFEENEPNSFIATYTVPQKVKDPIQLNDPVDFKQMVHEATSQKSAEIKLSIVEHKVCSLLVLEGVLSLPFYHTDGI
jgi:hypothetical protein